MASRSLLLVLLSALCLSFRTEAAQLKSIEKAAGTQGKTIYFNLTVSYGFWAPDCVQKQIYLINGQYPGPAIEATEGDTLVVRVTNKLGMEGLSFHWHGIRQLNSNLMDGVSFVTQCPISPKDYMDYTFYLDKAGTYLYHGHLEEQVTAGLYGSLIVKEKASAPVPYKVDGELSAILNDWWHRSVYEQIAGLEAKPFFWVGEAQSLLINGRGQYNCSLIPASPTLPVVGDVKTCNATLPQCARYVFEVEQGKTYRFRIGSIASLQSFSLAIEGHTLKVVAADGYAVKPFDVTPEQGLDVYPGQTVDVIFKASKSVKNYWVRTGVVARKPNTPFGLAILHYKGAPQVDPTTAAPAIRLWNDTAFAVSQADKYRGDKVPTVPKKSSRTVVLVGAQQFVDGYIKWAMNNYTLELPAVPYAHGAGKSQYDNLYTPTPPDSVAKAWNYTAPAPFEAKKGSGYYTFKKDSVIDIVLQNTNNIAAGASEAHPWHMHGHQFWVLGYGNGTYDGTTNAKKYNLVDPPFRNTVTVFPYGWVAIRLLADNPGTWMFHCHIGPHLHMGMGIVFVVGKPVKVPSGTPTCGVH